MLCRSVRSLLSAYTDGELSPADACDVRSHLDRCEACTREHSGLSRLISVTSSIPMEEAPASLHDRIVMRLAYVDLPGSVPAARQSRRSPMPRTWAWAAFTVAAAAIMGGAMQNRSLTDGRTRSGAPTVERVAPVEAPIIGSTEAMASAPAQPKRTEKDVAQPDSSIPMEVRHAEATVDAGTEVEVPRSEPVIRKLVPERLVNATPATPSDRPQPVAVSTAGRLTTEVRVSEPASMSPTAAMAKDGLMAMPGEPLMNGVTPLVPQDPGMPIDKDPTRMAGMAVEVETPGEEDEGLRSFRMFLQENGRTVPQPPTIRPRERSRKAL